MTRRSLPSCRQLANNNAVIVGGKLDPTIMTMNIPHRPRRRPVRRAASRCPDHEHYVFTVAYSDDEQVTVWTFSSLTDAERTFFRLQSGARRRDGDVRIHLGYTHVDCDEPQRHVYEAGES